MASPQNVHASTVRISFLSIEQAEWRSVLWIAIVLFAVTSVPYMFAYAAAPSDRVFMGIALNVPDHAQYFAWLRSHADAFLISNRMTPEPNGAVFFNLLWWMLAGIARAFGLQYAGVYQILRIIGVFVFVFVAYRLIAAAIHDRMQRMFALLLVCFTSGFGWVLMLLKYTFARGELLFPLDVYVAEGNTFLGALGSPHFLAAAAYAGCFELFLRAYREPQQRWRYLIACGLFAQFMGWQHAYDLLIIWGVLAVFVMLRESAVIAEVWQGAGRGTASLPICRLIARQASSVLSSLVIVGVLSSPPAIYALALTSLDPLWSTVLAQFGNAGVWTPPPWRLPVLFGFTFLAACAMAVRDVRRRLTTFSDARLLVLVWFLVSFVLIYLPTDYQIHMLNGWQIPMSILAARWIVEHAAPKLRSWFAPLRLRFVAGAFLLAVLPTNAYLFSWRLLELGRHQYDFYLTRADVSGLSWLSANADSEDVVLSSLNIGQYVPVMTDAHAYLAHWAQTAHFYARRDAVQRFFAAGTSRTERAHILLAHSVDYVFVGPAERRLPDFDVRATDGMRTVFSQEDVTIYAMAE